MTAGGLSGARVVGAASFPQADRLGAASYPPVAKIPLDSSIALAANHLETWVPRRCRQAACWCAIEAWICVPALGRLALLLHPCVADQPGSSALADILISCPRTGAPVSTGLKTEWVLLKSLPSVAVPLRCPACGQMHKWKPDDAWIGSARQSGDGNSVRASRTPLLMGSGSDVAKVPDCD
jgi:hypothetical protein